MPDYTRHKDLPYTSTSSERQAFDLYVPSSTTTTTDLPSSPPPLCVFIHGQWCMANGYVKLRANETKQQPLVSVDRGLCRGRTRVHSSHPPPESKQDWAESFMPEVVRRLGIPAACLDYRLAPDDPHPAQILDVVSGLMRLTSSTPLQEIETSDQLIWDRERLIVLGHSAGAFMIAEVLLSPPSTISSSSSPFVVAPSLRRAIKGAIFLAGIYDLPELIQEYPDYIGFVGMAFGQDPQVWANESPTNWEAPSEQRGGLTTKMLVLHSKQDELLSTAQPCLWIKALKRMGVEQGKHLDVDYETITGGHDDALMKSDSALLRRVKEWIDGL
ncbi:BQ2448_4126 [Microbotryum intermedium]|uniref:BQ2448_4126 protein n=1 Tax=Microbotryum intermedium TaxID=269621 RepID=A0A238FIH3_9BASI|nr:BQ2448_4126 [Microbotryum intermedium]